MAIAFETPPPESRKALQEGLDNLKLAQPSSDNSFLAKLNKFAGADNQTKQMPHQIYALRLDRLAAGSPLEKAEPEPLAWRYIVDPTPNSIVSADVRVGDKGEHVFSECGQNRIAGRMVTQLDALAKDKNLSQEKFTPRLLRVFGLSFAALWLHRNGAENFKNDIFIPLAGASASLTAGQRYSRDALAAALYKEAAEQIKLISETSS